MRRRCFDITAPGPSLQSAIAALQHNDLARAGSLLNGIIAADPDHARAQFLLGMVHARLGRLDEAEKQMLTATGLDPAMPEAWLKLGQTRELQRRYAEAEAPLRRALELNPAAHDARESLGRIFTELCRYDDAIAEFRRVLDQAPDRLSALDGLAGALRMSGRFTAAFQVGSRALTQAPNDPRILITMGRVCHDMGELEVSLQHYRNALRQSPGNALAIFGAAEVLERLGRREQALAELQPLLADIESNAQLLVLYTTICAHIRPDEPHIERLERALERDSLNPVTRERIHFLLGQLHDQAQRHDDAFRHYRAGNESVWRRVDDSGRRLPMDEIIEAFDALDFAALPRAQVRGVRPVFIVGMPRSGTSLVEQILASHPQVHGAGELNLIGVIAADLGYGTGSFRPDATTIDRTARRALDKLAKLAGGTTVVTDKMPQNFLYLGLIALLFPNAIILHTRRDPLDTCLSCYFHNFSGPNRYSYDLAQLGRYYRGYERLMDYWKGLGIEVFDVQYETLVMDLEGVSRRMVGYCGLEWDDTCLRYYENTRVTATASYDQVNKPIYTSSIGRWRPYEQHLGPLFEALEIPPHPVIGKG